MTYKQGWRKFLAPDTEIIWEEDQGENPWYESATEINSVELYSPFNRYELELGFGFYNMSSVYRQGTSDPQPMVLRRTIFRSLRDSDVGKQVCIVPDEVVIIPGKPARITNSYLVRLTDKPRLDEKVLKEITSEFVGQELVVSVNFLTLDWPEIRLGYD